MGRQRSSTIVNPMSVAHLHCLLQVKLKLGDNRSLSLGETRSGQRGGEGGACVHYYGGTSCATGSTGLDLKRGRGSFP